MMEVGGWPVLCKWNQKLHLYVNYEFVTEFAPGKCTDHCLQLSHHAAAVPSSVVETKLNFAQNAKDCKPSSGNGICDKYLRWNANTIQRWDQPMQILDASIWIEYNFKNIKYKSGSHSCEMSNLLHRQVLALVAQIFPKCLFLLFFCPSQTFYPNLPFFYTDISVNIKIHPYPWHFATMVVPAGADIRCRTKEKPGLSQSNIQSWPEPFQHHINFLYPRKKNPPLQLQIFATYHAEYRSMQGHPVVLDVDLIADSEQHQRRCPSFQKPRYLGGHRKI